jgi:RNA polymerase sigma-70 factor (ECF subfamily)
VKHFLANEWDKANRQKRGGGVPHLSLDWQSADEGCQLDPADPRSPDLVFEREWALALLERVIARLQQECARNGKLPLFEQAKGYLMIGEAQTPYAQAARDLGMEEGAVRVAVHRFRKRYRELLRDEIGQTLSDASQVDGELRALQAALAS